MKKALFTGLFLMVSNFSFADGGSSVAGPGAPQFDYGCYELNYVEDSQNYNGPDFTVSIVRGWPKYDLEISVIDRREGFVFTEIVTKDLSPAIGAPIVYKGTTYSLEINRTVTPIMQDDRIFSPGTLSKNGKFARSLKCEFVGQ